MRSLAACVLLAVVAGVVVACFQQVDGNAALDPNQEAGAPPLDLADASTWELCGSPSCDDPSGTIPFLQQTPPIFMPDGSTTADSCVYMESASLAVRATYCGGCHGPGTGAGQGGFNYVLDDNKLMTTLTSNSTTTHFVVPGQPYSSYLYARIANGTMPPPSIPGGPQNPVPTASDLSILYGWIYACLPGQDGGAYDFSGGNYGPGATVDAGAD